MQCKRRECLLALTTVTNLSIGVHVRRETRLEASPRRCTQRTVARLYEIPQFMLRFFFHFVFYFSHICAGVSSCYRKVKRLRSHEVCRTCLSEPTLASKERATRNATALVLLQLDEGKPFNSTLNAWAIPSASKLPTFCARSQTLFHGVCRCKVHVPSPPLARWNPSRWSVHSTLRRFRFGSNSVSAVSAPVSSATEPVFGEAQACEDQLASPSSPNIKASFGEQCSHREAKTTTTKSGEGGRRRVW